MAEESKFKASDMVKRLFAIGVGTVFLTEESLRSLFSEFKLPKELLGSVLESAAKTRKEFLQNISQEILNRVLERMDFEVLFKELIRENDFEFQVRVRVVPSAKK